MGVTNRISPNYKGFIGTLGGVPTGPSFGVPMNGWPRNHDGENVGRYYFVSGDSGNDGSDGLTPGKAKATIASAVTAANADINWSGSPWASEATIVIAPGTYAENLTALPYGATILGLGDAFDLNGQRGVLIKPAAGIAVDATSVINSRIHNIAFQSVTTSVTFQADNFNRNVMSHCFFVGTPGASPTTTRGLEIVKDMTGNHIYDCKFLAIRNGIYINTDNANSKQASGNLLENLWIMGGDQTGIYFDANSVPSYTTIRNSTIGGGGTTLALGLDDNTGIVDVSFTTFSATACDPASGDSDSKYNGCYLNGTLMT